MTTNAEIRFQKSRMPPLTMDSVLLIGGCAALALLRTRTHDDRKQRPYVAEVVPEPIRPLQRQQRYVQDSAADLERVPEGKAKQPSSPVGVLCNHAELAFISLDSDSSSAEDAEAQPADAEVSRRPEEADPPLRAGDAEWALHEPATEVDVRDGNSPDRWIMRHRQLIRLTGRCGRRDTSIRM